MGLSGRKEKQRIGHDPRNLSWADDAARFGQSYLSKFGWDSSQGLGREGDGRTSHVKVQQKLDLLGIGAAHQRDPDGIAWNQNKDFEKLLRRLNGGEERAEDAKEGTAVSGFHRAREGEEEIAEGEEGEKRKRADEGTEGESERKKRKKEKKNKKAKVTDQDKDEETPAIPATPVDSTPSTKSAAPIRGHRARFLRAKRLALTDSAAVSEVLGISRSATATPAPVPSTPAAADIPQVEGLQPLTTSSKSVMDYFKEKLLAKSNTGTPLRPSTPHAADDEDDAPRMGLGASRLRPPWAAGDVDYSPRVGLGGAGIGMHTQMSLAAIARASLEANVVETLEELVMAEKPTAKDGDEERQRRKRERKERKQNEKEATAVKVQGNGAESGNEETKKGVEKTKKTKKGKKSKAVIEADDAAIGGQSEDAEAGKKVKKVKRKKGSKVGRDAEEAVDVEETAERESEEQSDAVADEERLKREKEERKRERKEAKRKARAES